VSPLGVRARGSRGSDGMATRQSPGDFIWVEGSHPRPNRRGFVGRSECKRIANARARNGGRVRMKANANPQISARSRITADAQDRPRDNF
jgi:hypothetical protein